MTELKDVIATLDEAADSFDGIANKEQKKIYAEVLVLAKELELDNMGKVRQSTANLKRLTQIKAKLASLSKDKEWVAGIAGFAKYFGVLQKQQNDYFTAHFPSLTLSASAKEKNDLMRQMAVQNTMEALMGDGLKANVTDKLNDILLRAVTTGAKFADLQEELRAHLLGKEGGQGAFARYATTYATTALSQYTGQHNKLLSEGLDTDWYMYTGSNKETTREFCEQLTRKKYIHRSEIATILTGKIDDYQCAIYPKTGLPYGMIEGTTVENFQCNCGGWNCRHQLVPVADAVVPANLRAKFKDAKPKPVEEPIKQPAEGYGSTPQEKWMEDNKTWISLMQEDASKVGVSIEPFFDKGATQKALNELKSKIQTTVETRQNEWLAAYDAAQNVINKANEYGNGEISYKLEQEMRYFQWHTIGDNEQREKQVKRLLELTKKYQEQLDEDGGILHPLVTLLKEKINIKANRVDEFENYPKADDIIKRIGKIDKSKDGGSCSSVALAYIGNKVGYDVADFRGGDSRDFFSDFTVINNLAHQLKGKIQNGTNEIECAHSLLNDIKEGQEYYFTCGLHAAIVRKITGVIEYLELQGNKKDNGFKKLTDEVLLGRFGAKYNASRNKDVILIDINNFRSYRDDFKKVLSYINTK